MSNQQSPESQRPSPAPALDATLAAPLPVVADDATVITQRPPGSGSSSSRGSPTYDLGKLLAGERLNHFELLEYVGGGGMGAVFRARDTMLGREVALKVLSRDQGADEETRRRFQNEAQSAARLDHENIARVYFVGEDRGLNYIVFEFIQGVNLRDLVEKRGEALPLAEALSYTMQIARALEHAASRDVVHRDIKPSNVLITDEGKAKLVDMGLARLHQVNAAGADLTASGVTLGTFDYISPEQARDPRVADVRSDIYSLGCTLYYMLTARPPFPEGTVLQKLLQHNSDDPPDPREFNPSLPAQVSDVVRRMLAKNPRRRYQNPGELIADLVALAEAVGISTGGWAVPIPLPQGSSEQVPFLALHLPWLVPVGLLLAVVVALDVFSGSLPVEGTGQRQSVGAPAARRSRQAAAAHSAIGPTAAKGAHSPTATTGRSQAVLTAPAAAKASHNGQAAPSAVAYNSAGSNRSDPGQSTPSIMPDSGTDKNVASSETQEHLRAGLLVVGDGLSGPGRYVSLRAACAEAKTGDVIELRYNQRRDERPIALSNVRFTIRAGEGYRPVVVFRPDEADPVRYPRNMITVSGGRLVVLNVGFELHLPDPEQVPAESWSLFLAERPEALEFNSCTMSIVEHGEQTAFIAVRAAPGIDSMMASSDELMPEEPATVHLENCLLRGQASVLRVHDGEPLSFSWENGLAIAGDRFLDVSGSALSPRRTPLVQVSLEHVTAVVGRGFCQIANSFDAPYVPNAEIDSSDSILLAMSPCPLVEQHGLEGPNMLKRQFTWNGDRNFYEGFDADRFWLLVDESGTAPIESLSFLDWISHWGQQHELLPTWGEIAWKHLPPSGKPLEARDAADYALGDRSGENMAREGASDGRDVGMDPSLLPPLPSLAAEDSEPSAAASR